MSFSYNAQGPRLTDSLTTGGLGASTVFNSLGHTLLLLLLLVAVLACLSCTIHLKVPTYSKF